MIATSFSKATSLCRWRARRRDAAAFAGIGALLVLFFLVEFGWVIANHSHLGL